MKAEITPILTRNLTTDSKVDAPPGMAAPLHRSHPVTAAPLHLSLHVTTTPHHLSLHVTAAPRHLSHPATVAHLHLIRPMTAGPLPLSCPVMDVPHHVKTELSQGHFSRGALKSTAACQQHLQRAARRCSCKKEVKTASS